MGLRNTLAIGVLLALTACAASGTRETIATDDRGFSLPWAKNDRCNTISREGKWLGVASTFRMSAGYRQKHYWNDISWWVVHDPMDRDYKEAVINGRWPLPAFGSRNGTAPRNYISGAFLGVSVLPSELRPKNGSELSGWVRMHIMLPAGTKLDPDSMQDPVVVMNYDDKEGVLFPGRHIYKTHSGPSYNRTERWVIGAGGRQGPTGDADQDRHLMFLAFLFDPPAEQSGDILRVRVADRATDQVFATVQFDTRGFATLANRMIRESETFVANFQSNGHCYK
ncbi:MAG: hypothetical protein AAGB16_04580 [Pseudomonadota bacterium]